MALNVLELINLLESKPDTFPVFFLSEGDSRFSEPNEVLLVEHSKDGPHVLIVGD